MNDNLEKSGKPADDMSEYLQIFLDETEEQLDDLVETMLALEQDPANTDDLNEAFRLIHSIKGSAGMMGFDGIMVLTHHLENRFERFRSKVTRLDEPTMNLVLRCIDYLRQCNNRLRDGAPIEISVPLLEELEALEEQAEPAVEPDDVERAASQQPNWPPLADEAGAPLVRVVVRFRAGLQLADLKAQLIVARLAGLGEIKATYPDLEQITDTDRLDHFEIRLATREAEERLRAAIDVDGVESIEFPEKSNEVIAEIADAGAPGEDPESADPTAIRLDGDRSAEPLAGAAEAQSDASESSHEARDEPTNTEVPPQPLTASPLSVTAKAPAKVAETMRVDIDRLDKLMNLTGELVVNRAHFVQLSGQVDPALRKSSMLNRVRDFSDSLRRTIEVLESSDSDRGDWSAQIQQLRAGLELMEEQSEIWDNGRHFLGHIDEAIDQLSRVSHGLQRGVLDIRMVPVGPLFNRFRRVVRDLSKGCGKRVNLSIQGEKTELDKRMIDELGDPLVHLVRNSIDHGLEAPAIRASRGKPEVGTIYLEASHSGNNVYIHVRDDGEGIDVGKIKARLVDRQILSKQAADGLSHDQALDFIWHPGFSTASHVTDVSGRGVGMDVVKTRINHLNGTIEVDSTPRQGTTFTIRLPLTLAIIRSLLVRLGSVVFSMPMDGVREIVSVDERGIATVCGKQTFDVRGEFIPLVRIDDVFWWHGVDYGYGKVENPLPADSTRNTIDVVILQAGGNAMGLRVDELIGSQDIVIKSLSDNFVNVRGLSGASVLGDGSVCLMLDVGAVIDIAAKPTRTNRPEEVTA